jgi:hypothetical protein
MPVFFAEHLRFQQAAKELPVEELIPEPTVEAFTTRILPRTAGLDVERLKPALPDPIAGGPLGSPSANGDGSAQRRAMLTTFDDILAPCAQWPGIGTC